MSTHLTKINKLQRIDMIESGLNPLNPQHVDKYLAGYSGSNINENVERIKALMGDKLNANLGHGKEMDTDPNVGSEYTPRNTVQTPKSRESVADMRKNLMTEMNDYASSSPNVSPKGLMSLGQNQSVNNNSLDPKQAEELGKEYAANYYNTFILSLQNPGVQSNLNTFKALKSLLEKERELKGTVMCQYFQSGVTSTTNQMYNQLKG